jgi:hypothetical protein
MKRLLNLLPITRRGAFYELETNRNPDDILLGYETESGTKKFFYTTLDGTFKVEIEAELKVDGVMNVWASVNIMTLERLVRKKVEFNYGYHTEISNAIKESFGEIKVLVALNRTYYREYEKIKLVLA